MSEVKELVMVPVDKIKPNEWNPNEQSEETFNQLVEEIKEDGFDHPLNLVNCPEVKGEFVIIGGEHRWRAACLLGYKEVPCYIHDWDEKQQKVKTVRRNLISGKLNARKFTDLVEELSKTGIEATEMPDTLGFTSTRELNKHLIKMAESETAEDDTFIDTMKDRAKTPLEATDSLMSIVTNIFRECKGAQTVDQSYLFFTLKGSVQMAIMCDDTTWVEVQNMVAHLKETGESASEFIAEAIHAYMEDK